MKRIKSVFTFPCLVVMQEPVKNMQNKKVVSKKEKKKRGIMYAK